MSENTIFKLSPCTLAVPALNHEISRHCRILMCRVSFQSKPETEGQGAQHMQITDVECLVLDRKYPFVRVFTDEGIVGVGECFRRQPAVIKTIVHELLKPALLGKDPTDTEVRFRDMERAGCGLEMGGAVWCAIAGVDIALWDIKGKALNQPIWKLLGGKVRDKIRMYASSLTRDLTPLEEAKRAASFVEQGYSAYKLHGAVPGAIDDPSDQTVETVREVRAAVANDIDILVDVGGAYSVHHAIRPGWKRILCCTPEHRAQWGRRHRSAGEPQC